MKKLNLFLGAAFMLAFTSCTVSLNDNPIEPTPTPEPEPVDTRIKTVEEFTAALAEGGVIELAPGAEIALTEGITLTTDVEIVGVEDAPATITFGENGITTNSSISVSNVNINAAALTDNLVAMDATIPESWTERKVSFSGINVKGLSKALFFSTVKQYIFDFKVDNSVIEVTGDVTVFDFTKGSVATNFVVSNSTVYATAATTKSLYSSQGGQKASEVSSETQQVISFQNSTVYNFAKSKNFFTHRQSNQTFFTYDVQNCIFVDCGKSGQVIKGMNGGQGGKNPTWIIKGNVFNFDGADTSANEETGDADEPVTESIAAVVSFADAANGDFTQSDAKAGDPRWIK